MRHDYNIPYPAINKESFKYYRMNENNIYRKTINLLYKYRGAVLLQNKLLSGVKYRNKFATILAEDDFLKQILYTDQKAIIWKWLRNSYKNHVTPEVLSFLNSAAANRYVRHDIIRYVDNMKSFKNMISNSADIYSYNTRDSSYRKICNVFDRYKERTRTTVIRRISYSRYVVIKPNGLYGLSVDD
jgi:hypothetical protein